MDSKQDIIVVEDEEDNIPDRPLADSFSPDFSDEHYIPAQTRTHPALQHLKERHYEKCKNAIDIQKQTHILKHHSQALEPAPDFQTASGSQAADETDENNEQDSTVVEDEVDNNIADLPNMDLDI